MSRRAMQLRLLPQTTGATPATGGGPGPALLQQEQLAPVFVIEPHADDAYLSLGAHIEHWIGQRRFVRIVTVFGDARRSMEAAVYATACGASSTQLALPSAHVGITHDDPPLLVTSEQIRSALQDAVTIPLGTQVVLPLGLRHPEHRIVIAALAELSRSYYLEIPYCLTQKDQPALAALLQGREIQSILYPTRGKERRVNLFPSQSKFFFYNPPEKWARTMELIVGPPRVRKGTP